MPTVRPSFFFLVSSSSTITDVGWRLKAIVGLPQSQRRQKLQFIVIPAQAPITADAMLLLKSGLKWLDFQVLYRFWADVQVSQVVANFWQPTLSRAGKWLQHVKSSIMDLFFPGPACFSSGRSPLIVIIPCVPIEREMPTNVRGHGPALCAAIISWLKTPGAKKRWRWESSSVIVSLLSSEQQKKIPWRVLVTVNR